MSSLSETISDRDMILISDSQWRYIQSRHQMTDREVDVARLVCTGCSNEQIADKLDIKSGKGKTHIRNS